MSERTVHGALRDCCLGEGQPAVDALERSGCHGSAAPHGKAAVHAPAPRGPSQPVPCLPGPPSGFEVQRQRVSQNAACRPDPRARYPPHPLTTGASDGVQAPHLSDPEHSGPAATGPPGFPDGLSAPVHCQWHPPDSIPHTRHSTRPRLWPPGTASLQSARNAPAFADPAMSRPPSGASPPAACPPVPA
ncbi:hypothetical protein LMG29542_08728 [Paraburkholderia humisilvae]|uniref:Uncharacterized protein n=1 Tax=Paraburkholderia humisilvae TaxID=627669 RepID=A0A6J5FDI9_9BURK|nr:hypothetical protein LMG29542_08728 [Paraburkholderia humisilvae]